MRELTTFLLELYVPKADCTAVTLGAARLAHAAAKLTAEGTPVRMGRTIFVPEDETCYVLVEAATVETVRQAAERASLPLERVVATTGDPATRDVAR
jgi:hypothetical protein